jgi:hypothetical protein
MRVFHDFGEVARLPLTRYQAQALAAGLNLLVTMVDTGF